MEPPRPPIFGIPATLDQTRFLQPIDNPAQGDRLDIEMIGKLDLAKARLAPEPCQGTPLCAGHPKWRGATIKLAAQAVRGLGNLERDFL